MPTSTDSPRVNHGADDLADRKAYLDSYSGAVALPVPSADPGVHGVPLPDSFPCPDGSTLISTRILTELLPSETEQPTLEDRPLETELAPKPKMQPGPASLHTELQNQSAPE